MKTMVPILILCVADCLKGWRTQEKKRFIIPSVILLGLSAIQVILLRGLQLPIAEASFLTMVVLSTSSFLFFHVYGHQVSIQYQILYLISNGMLLFLSIRFPQTKEYTEYLMLVVYLLAAGNMDYMRKSYEESANEYQNKILTKQVEEVQNMYLTMRGWRHDYHNHLQTLKAHIKMDQIEQAKEYLNRLEDDLDHVNEMIESGNVGLDAILNSKLSLAQKHEIEIDYKATVPDKLTVSDLDLCVIIGNLIDNAVESCDKMTEGRRFLRLYIGVLRQQLYISVTNSTNELVRKLDEEYITTKRGNHGHGLKRIDRMIAKYEGFINRKNEPGVFVTEIMLPL